MQLGRDVVGGAAVLQAGVLLRALKVFFCLFSLIKINISYLPGITAANPPTSPTPSTTDPKSR